MQAHSLVRAVNQYAFIHPHSPHCKYVIPRFKSKHMDNYFYWCPTAYYQNLTPACPLKHPMTHPSEPSRKKAWLLDRLNFSTLTSLFCLFYPLPKNSHPDRGKSLHTFWKFYPSPLLFSQIYRTLNSIQIACWVMKGQTCPSCFFQYILKLFCF